jgi:superoxide dismutase
MEHKLPELPFTREALAPYLSPETLEYHHGKHHRAYVDNFNKLIAGNEYENLRWKISWRVPAVVYSTTAPRPGITHFTGIVCLLRAEGFQACS